MTSDSAILDYERLVEDYNASLFATLRHHRSAGALEIWVPDDDPGRSILNMVEAAEIAGVSEINVRINAQTLERLDDATLAESAARYGAFSMSREGDSAVISVTQIGGGNRRDAAGSGTADWFSGVGAPYREAIRNAAGRVSHEGEPQVPHGTTRHAASLDGMTLIIAVNERHVIVAAGHTGAVTRPDRAVLDAMCGILAGLPVQEAADHAALRLERALRADGERPVPGIVLPENADPAFVRPSRLVREVAAAYAAFSGYAPGRNTFTPRPSDEWLALPRDDKMRRLGEAIDEATESLGLRPGDLTVMDIEHHIRATLAFAENVDVAVKPRAIMTLERKLRGSLEPALQLFSIELKDANKLRRLKELP
ncbi:MAG: hypothetical protein ACRENA_12105 [Vulcanimicrobiaceae bacterium]